MASTVTRPRGAPPTNVERRQKPLHPDVVKAQEKAVAGDHHEAKKAERPESSADKPEEKEAREAKPPAFNSGSQTPVVENQANNIQKPTDTKPVDAAVGSGKGSASVSTPPAPNPRA